MVFGTRLRNLWICWAAWRVLSLPFAWAVPAVPPPPLQTNEVSPALVIAPVRDEVSKNPVSKPGAAPTGPSATNAVPIDPIKDKVDPDAEPGVVEGPSIPSRDPHPSLTRGIQAPWPADQLQGTMISLKEWAAHFGLAAPRRVSDTPSPTYEIRTGPLKALIRIGSPKATVAGIDVMLGHLPQFVGGDPCLHRLDFQKTLYPLLWQEAIPLVGTNRVIVVDAGHGGKDVGTSSPDGRFYEKTATLDWALRLRRLLEAQGWKVICTRTNDIELSLAQRVLIAEECKAALFISLHFNSAQPVHERRGLETYALTPAGLASSLIREGEDNPKLWFQNNGHDLSNLLLAWRIQKGLLNKTGAADRAVQRARFLGVLRGQDRPAILVEGGYLSNAEEARRIGDPSYRQKLAEGIAFALRELKPMNPEQSADAKELSTDPKRAGL